MGVNVLELNKVSVPLPGKFGDAKLLVENTSFSLQAGQVLGVIGPNGAGKSSLLKAIEGRLKHHGTISMPNIASDHKTRAKQFAVLPQQSLLNFPFTVTEVVELGRIPHATGKQADAKIVQEVLALMDISDLANRIYTQLSGGEKQRVQLARVFCQIWHADEQAPTRILLLDEPSTALDLGHQHFLMQAVRAFAARGVAIIMVMHDINLAARYTDHLLALLDSKPIAYGTPDEVVTKTTMQQLFGLPVEILVSAESGSPVVIGM